MGQSEERWISSGGSGTSDEPMSDVCVILHRTDAQSAGLTHHTCHDNFPLRRGEPVVGSSNYFVAGAQVTLLPSCQQSMLECCVWCK